MMGRTDGKLLPFLKGALNEKKYFNLRWEEKDKSFMFDLPRQSSQLDPEYEKVLKDYYMYDGQPYKDYSTAKGVIKAAMNKSFYLKNLDKNKASKKTDKTLMRYEFTGFKRLRKSTNRSGPSSPSVSSGYGSEGVPSPLSLAEGEDELPVLQDEFLSFLNADTADSESPVISEILDELKACTEGDVKNPHDAMEGVQGSVSFLQTKELASDGAFRDMQETVIILQTTENKIEDLAPVTVPLEIVHTVWIFSEKLDVNSMQLLVFQPHQVANGFSVPYKAITVLDQGHNILLPAITVLQPRSYYFKILAIENDRMIVLLK